MTTEDLEAGKRQLELIVPLIVEGAPELERRKQESELRVIQKFSE